MKRLLNAIIIMIALSQTAIADDKIAVRDFLKSKLDDVLLVLERKDLDDQTKKDTIVEIAQPIFDFSLMAKLTLGRKHWPGLSKENKDKFTELFTKLLKESFLRKMDLYTDEKLIYEEPLQVKKKIHIPTCLTSKDNKISILYKLHKSHNNWKIYDIEIQGVSIIRSYRSQFSESLQSGTIEELITKLEKIGSDQ
ncbi:MAG: ABC transporter substrate-binding protein [Deltaproteobacteria bacterium]|nr:ABC transporter substrate-binding protein [Deltaproteobacteria bacterium]